MASVHIGRLTGAIGFSRTVAIKRLHTHLAQDQSFVGMFVDEARLASRIRHPNVVDTLDVVLDDRELYIVMEFVLGETFSRIVRAAAEVDERLPPAVTAAIVVGALEGLHAAHEATTENGEPLGIVHRDISPQNILVGRDGVARVLDFGIAKAAGRLQETSTGEVKGKLAYMAPEQLTRGRLDRRCDVFAMGIVLWEALTGRRLFASEDPASTMYSVMHDVVVPPSEVVPGIPKAVDAVVLKGLARDQNDRWGTARDMAAALEAACQPASAREVGEWVTKFAAAAISARSELVTQVEKTASTDPLYLSTGSPFFVGPPTPHSFRMDTPPVSGTMPSAVTSMAATSDASPPPPKRGSGVFIALAAFAALALIGGGLGLFALTRPHQPSAAATSGSVPLVQPTTEASAVATTTAEAKPIEPAPPETSAPVAAPATPTAPPATHAANPHARPTTKPGAKPEPPKPDAKKPEPPKPSAPAVDCENPFYVDSSGMKRPKPACFGR
jgi:serine/threonine-protein kinase